MKAVLLGLSVNLMKKSTKKNRTNGLQFDDNTRMFHTPTVKQVDKYIISLI